MPNPRRGAGSLPHIAVIVPCYNEERHVEGVVASMPDFVRTIIVVDDGSTDGTRAALERMTDSRVVRIYHGSNKGVGAAVVSGYRAALERSAGICVKMDGDAQMSSADLPRLLAPILSGEADFTKGNRLGDLRALATMPVHRLIGNAFLSFFTKLVSGYWSILDPTNGYTSIQSDVLSQIDLSRLASGFYFETSMLVELNIQGAVVRDVYLRARYGDEESSLRAHRILSIFPFLLARSLMRRFLWKYLLQDFNIVTVAVLGGIPCLLFGAGFGGYHWYLSIATGVPATAGTIIVAALPIILGFQLLLTAFVGDILSQPAAPLIRDERITEIPLHAPDHGPHQA